LKEQAQILRSNKECEKYPQVKCPNYPRCHEFAVKIFAHEIEAGLVEDAVSSILGEMGFSFIDNLVISLDQEISNKMLDHMWQQMERVVSFFLLIFLASNFSHKKLFLSEIQNFRIQMNIGNTKCLSMKIRIIWNFCC